MALMKCKECGAQISTSAKLCPQCGYKPRRTSLLMWGATILLLIFFGVPFLAGSYNNKGDNQATGCAGNYKSCKDNADLINNYDQMGKIFDAKVACKRAIGDHVKYGSPEWGALVGFGSYRRGDDFPKTGIIMLVDDNVKIQNMYGTKVNSTVACEYDLNYRKVLTIVINGEPIILATPQSPEPLTSGGSPTSATQKFQTAAVQTVKPNRSLVLQELFGINDSSEKVRLPTNKLASIWFDQTFENGGDKIYVVFVKEQALDAKGELDSCHACGVVVDVVTYKAVSGGWVGISKQNNITEIGSYGDAPKSNHGDILQLSPGKPALLINSEDGGQGYTDSFKHILAYSENQWHHLGNVQISGDNAGTAECADQHKCWQYSGDISVEPSNNSQYPNIVVKHTGTKFDAATGKIVPAGKAIYSFNGKAYVESKK